MNTQNNLSQSEKTKKGFYDLISFVFQPLFMPFFGMLLLANLNRFSYYTFGWKLILILGTTLFTIILPMIPILIMMKRGDIKDLFMSRKEERTMPYLFTFLGYTFWAFFLWRTMHLPLPMVGMAGGGALSILLVAFINLKWKISAHMLGIGGLVGGIFSISYRLAINPLWVLVTALVIAALVAISRIQLKAHTALQVLGGFVLGFLCVFLPCILIP